MMLGPSPEVTYLVSQLNNRGGAAFDKATVLCKLLGLMKSSESKVAFHSPLSYQCGTQSDIQREPPPSVRT